MAEHEHEHEWTEAQEAVSEYGEYVFLQRCRLCRLIRCERLTATGEIQWVEISNDMIAW